VQQVVFEERERPHLLPIGDEPYGAPPQARRLSPIMSTARPAGVEATAHRGDWVVILELQRVAAVEQDNPCERHFGREVQSP
jgi:hypothetical protein